MGFKTLLSKLREHSQRANDSTEPAPAPAGSSRRSVPPAFDNLRRPGSNAPAPGTFSFSPLAAGAAAGGLNPNPIELSLKGWADNAPPGEQGSRAEAVKRILAAHNGHSSELSLSRLKLTSLPSCMSKLNVTSLHVNGNALQQLPALPRRLEQFNAEGNKLVWLPTLPASLRSLNVSDNALWDLPRLPPTLTRCQASENHLMRIPELPASLEWLAVDHNRLPDLPALPASLNFLDASSNQMTKLPHLPDAFWAEGDRLNLMANLSDNPFSAADLRSAHADLDAAFAANSIERSRVCLDLPKQAERRELLVKVWIKRSLDAWTTAASDGEHAARMTAAGKIREAFEGGASELTLAKLGLTSLPDCLAQLNIQKLDVTGNGLKELPSLPPRLQALSASKNGLETLPQFPLSMITIDVSDNRLTRLPTLPPRLEAFRASNNMIKSFKDLPETLQRLDIADNLLTSLPPLPRALQELDASGNRLTMVPTMDDDAWSTTRVNGFKADLRRNQFSEEILQSAQGRLDPRLWVGSTAHERLQFDAPVVPVEGVIAYQIKEALETWTAWAPENEWNARALTADLIMHAYHSGAAELDIAGLKLSSLPDCLSMLTIQRLNVDGNRLGRLPDLPGRLEMLSANANGLRALPELPPTLQFLWVSNNKLTSLPRLPETMSTLNFSGNRLTEIPDFPEMFWQPGPPGQCSVDMRKNAFSESALREFRNVIADRFGDANRARTQFIFDAPPPAARSHPAIEPHSVAMILNAKDAADVVTEWRNAGVANETLAALRADIDGYLLNTRLSGDDFNARHGAGAADNPAALQFFSADSRIDDGALRKAFAYLRKALPVN